MEFKPLQDFLFRVCKLTNPPHVVSRYGCFPVNEDVLDWITFGVDGAFCSHLPEPSEKLMKEKSDTPRGRPLCMGLAKAAWKLVRECPARSLVDKRALSRDVQP